MYRNVPIVIQQRVDGSDGVFTRPSCALGLTCSNYIRVVFLGCRSVSLRTRAVLISLHIHIPTRTDFFNSRRHRYQEPKGVHECKHHFLPISLQAIDGRVGLSVIFIEHIRIKGGEGNSNNCGE